MIKKITVIFIIFLSAHYSFSQKNNTSPYSFFGIGEETSNKTVEELSMGEIGVAFNSPLKLTFSNPASFASLRLTNYALGLETKTLRINDGTNKGTAASTALSYLALGIPVGNKAGFSFGLIPNTTVGYSLKEQLSDTETNFYTGEGGTNKVFLGIGYRLAKGLNFGLEGSYIFGNIKNTIANTRVIEPVSPFPTVYLSEAKIKGFAALAGVQYEKQLKEQLNITLGATIDFNTNLTNEGNEYMYSTITSTPDTTVNKSFKGDIKKPLKTTLGAGIGNENKWYAGIEYSFQDALELSGGALDKNTLISYGNSNRLSLGGFYIPKFNSITSYWQRMTYRAGLKFKKTGLIVEDTAINDFGMSFGVGLPIGQQLSNLNLGFELGKRGEIKNGLIKENYINFRLSLTLNDKWFRKKEIY